MRKYLLIGGPADGRRVELSEPLSDIFNIPALLDPITPSIYQGGDYSFDIADSACERLEYWLNTFRVAGVDFTVYTYGRYDVAIIVQLLLENYKRV